MRNRWNVSQLFKKKKIIDQPNSVPEHTSAEAVNEIDEEEAESYSWK